MAGNGIMKPRKRGYEPESLFRQRNPAVRQIDSHREMMTVTFFLAVLRRFLRNKVSSFCTWIIIFCFVIVRPCNAGTLRLAFIGDIMVHLPQLEAAWNRADKTYDFLPQVALMKRVLSRSDIVAGNLETTLASGIRGFTGYPCFNSPDSLLTALKEIGLSVLTTANNHCMDSGAAGAVRTARVIDEHGFFRVGVRLKEDTANALRVEKNDVNVTFLSYTYGTNGIRVPSDSSIVVPLIQSDTFSGDIARARRNRNDLLVAAFHFGPEYAVTPSKEQKTVAALALRSGADVIFGTHPHVLQPIQISRNSKTGRLRVAAYSLGNFLSSQRTEPRDRSCVLLVDVKTESDRSSITKVAILPIRTRWKKTRGNDRIAVSPIVHERRRLIGRRDPSGMSEERELRSLEKSICASLRVYHDAEPDGAYTLWEETQTR